MVSKSKGKTTIHPMYKNTFAPRHCQGCTFNTEDTNYYFL